MTDPVSPGARLVHFGAADVLDVVLGGLEGQKLATGLLGAEGLSSGVRIQEGPLGGWDAHLDGFRAIEGAANDPPPVAIVSISEEIADPSPDPSESLRSLATAVRDAGGRLIVLNGSTLTPGEPFDGGDDPLALRIRRLNLVALEGSKATGLCVLDVDRIVAATSIVPKVIRPFEYAGPICEAVQAELVRILRELGVAAQRSVMELTAPFVRQASGQFTVKRWLAAEGQHLGPDDVVCELQLLGVRGMARPTNAVMLASINERQPLLQRLFNRERTYEKPTDATVLVVSADAGVLRSIVRPPGTAVGPYDRLALLTSAPDTPLSGDAEPSPFRAVARIDDPTGQLTP